MSGFREGWAVKARDTKAHYFRREGASIATALCGAQDSPAGWLAEAGDAPACARCAGLIARGRAGKQPGELVGSHKGSSPRE